ncbi:MAG: anti-sigma factor family protein, partial [Alphaproteobacteria bacterium]
MMGQDDDRLMAFLDGELDEAGRAEVEAAIAADPALAARLEAQRRLRDRLRAHYGPVADEPVPDRLRSLIETNVVPFRPPHRAARPAWQLPAAIAASLVLGILGGRILPGGGPVALDDGRLEARGALAAALQTQLAADQAADAVTDLPAGRLPRFRSGITMRAASRALVERRVRRRVEADERVRFLAGREATGLVLDGPGERVIGVRTRVRGE